MGWSNLVDDRTGSGLMARFRMQPTGSKREAQIVREIIQPDRNIVMSQIREEEKAAHSGQIKDLSFGRYVGSIPMVDILKLQKSHPDVFSPDSDTARKATIKFMNSSEGRQYRVQRA